ncbi:MAG: hypothetical protein QM569_14935 [Acidovorax sp.]|uniref:hypothetical protein n=1 Tax=Acidovorax sp. TaxID=1872122 RepID=UPI0039E4135A
MSELTITQAHRDARSQATLDYANLGTAASRIDVYDAAEVLLVTLVLARPAGVLVDHVIVLQQADATGDLISVSGTADHAVWVNGNGDVVGSGAVTASDGEGPFVLAGTAEGSTALYAGGRCLLGVTALG